MPDSMIFYSSFSSAIKRLPPEEQLKALWSILDYGLDGKEPEEDGFFRIIFDMAKPQIDANIKRKTNGSGGGRPAKTNGCESKKPMVSETKTNGYANEKPKAFTNYMKEGKQLFYTNEKEYCAELTSSKLSEAWKPIAWMELPERYEEE